MRKGRRGNGKNARGFRKIRFRTKKKRELGPKKEN